MEETEQRSAVPACSSTSSVRVPSGAPPPSSSSLHVNDEDEVAESAVVRIQRPELSQPRSIVSYRVNVPTLDETSTLIRDDTWSCVIVLLTFWFFGQLIHLYLCCFKIASIVNRIFLCFTLILLNIGLSIR